MANQKKVNLNKIYDTKSQLNQAKRNVKEEYISSLVTTKGYGGHTYSEKKNPVTRDDVVTAIKLGKDLNNKEAYNKQLNKMAKGDKSRAKYIDEQLKYMSSEVARTKSNGKKTISKKSK